ncbi:MAG: hypothetical protein Q7R30_10070 [Acidobacteriota bacterium]|nr:hypothetical protein [Acidobacteriota bacterium]
MPRRTPGSDNRVLLVCRLLNRRRARYLITGGVAANLHGSVRATKDVDLLIPKDAANARRVLDALADLPLGISRELDAEQVASRPFTIVGDMPRVNLLTVACTVTFEKAWPNRIVRRINGIRVKYLGRADLIRSKRTGRASDRADIEVLLRLKGAP